MDVRIEAGVATLTVSMTEAVVAGYTKVFFTVARLVSQTAPASFLRLLRSGRSSMSAIPGDSNFITQGGRAVFAA